MQQKNRTIGGILLVSGTTIGAGMLAMPVSTGIAGFWPGVALLVACWAFMTYTAFLILEMSLSMGHDVNLISMARRTLGYPGEVVTWCLYLFLLYALTTAYIAGSEPILVSSVQLLTGFTLPSLVGSIPLLLIFGIFVYKGTAAVDRANRFLMLGLVVSYVVMVALLTPHVDTTLFRHVEWSALSMAVSLVVTSFGFHIVIPSLTTYLHRDVQQLRRVIVIGSAIPLFVYIIWQALMLGVIPVSGPYGLYTGYQAGMDSTQLLEKTAVSSLIKGMGELFSFFAIITSFLGVSLSLSDCLADALKIKKTRLGRMGLYLITFVPPVMITLIDPRAFFTALEYAGAFGVMTLLGLLPAMMVWRGRYDYHLASTYKAPGGKLTLLLIMGLALVVVCLEIANELGWGGI